jgi:hypothetical protein
LTLQPHAAIHDKTGSSPEGTAIAGATVTDDIFSHDECDTDEGSETPRTVMFVTCVIIERPFDDR